jgi:putative transposase
MPDHVHAILQGRFEAIDALGAFYKFKLRTGIQLDRFCRPAHWQKDFYDHIVRCDGDWRGQAKYVALNPVRAGLVQDPFDYPFAYLSLDTRQEILSQIFWDG